MSLNFNRFIAVATACIMLIGILGCSSSTWEDAEQADTHEAYQAYIADNPEGEHMEEAKRRADTRYWDDIKTDTTAAAFETYLDEFPDGQFRSQAQTKRDRFSSNGGTATSARVTGSNVIIRSDHTTTSASAGVVARKGTIVKILDRYSTGNSDEAILKQGVTIVSNGTRINLPEGKAIDILSDRNDSVRASFSTPEYGATQATISKDAIEAMSGETWYKIRTNDEITGWIYGKFIEEIY
jgi:hypothetical protein